MPSAQPTLCLDIKVVCIVFYFNAVFTKLSLLPASSELEPFIKTGDGCCPLSCLVSHLQPVLEGSSCLPSPSSCRITPIDQL